MRTPHGLARFLACYADVDLPPTGTNAGAGGEVRQQLAVLELVKTL